MNRQAGHVRGKARDDPNKTVTDEWEERCPDCTPPRPGLTRCDCGEWVDEETPTPDSGGAS